MLSRSNRAAYVKRLSKPYITYGRPWEDEIQVEACFYRFSDLEMTDKQGNIADSGFQGWLPDHAIHAVQEYLRLKQGPSQVKMILTLHCCKTMF